MKRILMATFCVSLLAVSACNHAPRVVATTAPLPVPAQSGDTVHITLQRTPCFGTCPVYTLEIANDGTVSYNGARFVTTVGPATAKIPRADVVALRQEFDRIGYASFAPRYTTEAGACGPATTDAPTVTTSITVAGRTTRVEHYHGCGGAPAALTTLETRIDSVAHVTRWTRGEQK